VAAISCGDFSNLTFSALPGGSLSASADSAIGTSSSGACDRLSITNGTFDLTGQGGAAIGTGNFASSASLRALVIADGGFTLTKGAGAGIGTGAVSGALSTNSLGLLLIENGTFAASGTWTWGGRRPPAAPRRSTT
jgi:hypothetical protein